MLERTDEHWRKRLTIPTYRVGEAASYARISPQTVAAWHKPRSGRHSLSEKPGGAGLSFLQLIELAVVADMRRMGVKLTDIREARDYFMRTTGMEYPFAQIKFKTDGADILSDVKGHLGKIASDKLIAANYGGQYIWTEMLSSRFKQFNYDADGAVDKWRVAGVDKDIEINPRLAFGAPQIEGVKTGLIKGRFVIGEEIDEIAEDYSIGESQVVEALLFEGLDRSNPRISRWIN